MPFGKPTTSRIRSKLIEKYKGTSDPFYLYEFLRCEEFEDIEHILQSIKDIKEFFNGYGGKYFSWSDTPLQINFIERMQTLSDPGLPLDAAIALLDRLHLDSLWILHAVEQ